jgi:virginiamycin B lyase
MAGRFLAAAVLLAALAGCKRAGPTETGLYGGVTAPDGSAAAGLMVTARAANGIEETVFTGGDGRFSLSGLADGAYQLTVRGGGLRADGQSVTVEKGRAPALAIAARADERFLETLPSSHWLSLLPDGDMKQEFILNCASCHEIGYSRIFKDGAPRDAARWLEAIKMMRAIDVYKLTPPDFDDEAYAAWLAENLSPERIATLRPAPAPDPASVAGLRITEYPVPEPDELPHDLVVGPDGRIWVTAFWHGKMWALTPETGAIESFDVNETPETIAQVRALEFDRNGILWMINGGTQSVVSLDPKTRGIRTYPVGMYAHDIDLDSKGNVWFNDYFAVKERIGTLDVTSGQVTHFDLPSADLPESAGVPLPYGMQIDAEDRLWSTQMAANTLALFEIRSGRKAMFAMPNANSGPRRTAVSADGGLWIPEFNTGRLLRFDPATESFEQFDTGNRSLGPYDVEFSPKTGDIWITGSLNSSMLRFDPKAKAFTEYPLPTEPAYNRHIAVDADTGDVWIAYSSLPTAVPKVARLRFAP